MGDWEKECLDCGWRGMTGELDASADKISGETVSSCPDCGGAAFKDRTDRDEK